MGCNCGGKKAGSTYWVYTNANGEQTKYATEVEAKSAWLRGSKTGSYREVSKT